MTETKFINGRLAKNGRIAYKNAKSKNKAFITIGNSIYHISADGTREKIGDLTSTRVKATQKTFVIR